MLVHKVAPLGQLGSVHLHNEIQQNFVLDGTSFIHPRASLPAIQARTDDDVRLFTDLISLVLGFFQLH